MTADEQTPEWEGATNLRHLSGAVYRMGLPERITARGWQQMAADGVTTLVDLRNDDELGRREPGWAGVDPPESISVVHRPVEDQSNAEFMDLCRTILDHPAYYPHNLRLFPELVCRAVVAIGQADGGVVVHCGAGRDRTGLISALLLTLAEAPQTVILDGYAAGVRGFNDSLVDYPVAHEPHRDETALEIRLRPRLEALAAFLEATDVAEFLLAAGARPAELNAVRDKVR